MLSFEDWCQEIPLALLVICQIMVLTKLEEVLVQPLPLLHHIATDVRHQDQSLLISIRSASAAAVLGS